MCHFLLFFSTFFVSCFSLQLNSVNVSYEYITYELFADGHATALTSNLMYRSYSDKNITFQETFEVGNATYKLTEINQMTLNHRFINSITIPGTVKTLKNRTFFNCRRITNVILLEGVETIEPYAFYNSQITSLTLPDSLINIMPSAIYSSTINDIKFGDKITDIPKDALNLSLSYLKIINIGKNVKNIDGLLCSRLTPKTIIVHPNNTNFVVDDQTLYDANCTVMYIKYEVNTRFIVENSIKELCPYCACYDAYSSVIIGSGLEVFPYELMIFLRNVNEWIVSEENKFYASYLSCLYTHDFKRLLKICTKSKFKEIHPQTTEIENYTFNNYRAAPVSTNILKNIIYIGDYAFYNSYITGELIFNASCHYIGQYAFMNCYSIQGKLVLPDEITVLNNRTFYNIKSFKGKLILPHKLRRIGEYVFCDVVFLGPLIIPSKVEEVLLSSFFKCKFEYAFFGPNLKRYNYMYIICSKYYYLGADPIISRAKSDMITFSSIEAVKQYNLQDMDADNYLNEEYSIANINRFNVEYPTPSRTSLSYFTPEQENVKVRISSFLGFSHRSHIIVAFIALLACTVIYVFYRINSKRWLKGEEIDSLFV